MIGYGIGSVGRYGVGGLVRPPDSPGLGVERNTALHAVVKDLTG